MENAIKSAKHWNIWLQSILLLSGKSFPLWGGDFLEPFVKTHICTYSMCIFTVQGVLKNGQCHEVG